MTNPKSMPGHPLAERPDWADSAVWNDFGASLEPAECFGEIHLYAFQGTANGKSPYGGVCGAWFDTNFTDIPDYVTCARCIERGNEASAIAKRLRQ